MVKEQVYKEPQCDFGVKKKNAPPFSNHFVTLVLFFNLRPTRGPSPMELALGISAALPVLVRVLHITESDDHNDKRHSVPGRISKEL